MSAVAASLQARGVAFVTGASYGIGAATAAALARDGFDVAISATKVENLANTAQQIEAAGRRAVAVALDLASQSSIEHAFGKAVAALGRVDLLVNNAGVNLRQAALDVTPAQWDEMMRVNARGTFFMTQQMGRHLVACARPGRIVSIASTHAAVGAPERSTYGISKAAIVQMTRMLAIEWAPHGICVNAIAPGRVDTPSPSRAASAANAQYMQAMLKRIPLGRLATSEDVAAAVCYLASPQAAYITGQTLFLDGGLTAV